MNIIIEILILFGNLLLCYLQSIVRIFYKPKKDLSEKTAILTGGGGGIGQYIALELVRRKVKLAIWDIDKDAAEKVKEDLIHQGYSDIMTYKCDITKKSEVQRVAMETRKDIGEIDFLFNNAGVLYARDILDLPEVEIRRTMEVNLISQFWTIQEFLPSMLKRNYGHIVNTVSMAGKFGFGYLTDYAASKFGTAGLTDALRMDIERRGKDVKVSGVFPGIVKTSLVSNTEDHCTPYARFDKFIEPDSVGRQIVEGMERDLQSIYIPARMFGLTVLKILTPERFWPKFVDFLCIGFFPKDYKLK